MTIQKAFKGIFLTFSWNIQALEMGYWLPMLTTGVGVGWTNRAPSQLSQFLLIWTKLLFRHFTVLQILRTYFGTNSSHMSSHHKLVSLRFFEEKETKKISQSCSLHVFKQFTELDFRGPIVGCRWKPSNSSLVCTLPQI